MNTRFLIYFGIVWIMILSFSSCNNKWKTFVVKAGDHSTNELSSPLLNVSKIDFSFKVNSTWYYPKPQNPGWNKIRGFSNGQHQENSSARLGYQCLDDTLLVVGAYCYVDGVSPQENQAQKGIIDTIQPGKVYHCTISRVNGEYLFQFGKKKWVGPAGKDLNWGYLLNPYVGGEFTFDHDWVVQIKE